MLYYLDTNIFVYAAAQTIYSEACQKVLDLIANNKINGATSLETIQEVVFLGQKQKNIDSFIAVAQGIMELVELFSVEELVINEYLKLSKQYPNIISRDLLHVATCKIHSINTIISLDKDLDNFKQENIIKLVPQDIL